MPLRIAVVADDLTSAGDGAAPFRAAGHRARVVLGGRVGLAEAGVTAVDTDSRAEHDASAAAARVAAAVALVAAAELLVKTVDSTVRGHLLAELDAALGASGRAVAVVAPAFPGAGRTTSRGRQLLHGHPVEQTGFAADPDHPVRTSDLLRLLPGAVLRPPGSGLLPDGRVVVADATTDADLDAVVASVPDPTRVLWVGSPGLSQALARAHPASPAQAPPRTSGAGLRRIVVAVGSRQSACTAHVQRLVAAGTPVVTVTAPDPISGARVALERHGTVALVPPRTVVADPASALDRIGAVTAALHDEATLSGLVLTGGATARAVLLALGVSRVDLLDEPEPGITLGLVPPDGPWVVLKAGGFGDSDVLVRATTSRSPYLSVPPTE